ncbi:hypothetical protein C1X64_30190 [Pseudomonas sp. GW456-E7]|nr:hypothetical protein C1X64_30190 [Pseudomonas sp. GW456-E7]
MEGLVQASRSGEEGAFNGRRNVSNPFEKSSKPFLEVHHVKHLTQESSDRPSNAVALRPNCHRRCHHSSNREKFTALLYERVGR